MKNLMRNLIFSLPVICFLGTACGQGVLLNPGESHTFEFTSLYYLRAALPAEINVGGLSVDFPKDGFLGGELVQVDRFDNTLSDTPISTVFSLPNPSGADETLIMWSWANDQPFWTDMEGVVRVTDITGSVRLGGVTVNALINGGVYGAYLVVPEPSSAALLFLGAGSWIVRRLHRDRRTNQPDAANPAMTRHSHPGAQWRGVADLER